MSRAALDRAYVLFQDWRRYDLAEVELGRALEENPDDPGAHYLLALALGNQGRHVAGLEHANRTVALAPEWHAGFQAQAWNFYVANRFPQAERAIREALRLSPRSVECWRVLACMEIDRRHWREALSVLDQALAIEPTHTDCLHLRARVLAELGQTEAALATSETGLRIDPTNPAMHAAHGRSLLDNCRADLAFDHFREALRLNPQSEEARQGALTALETDACQRTFFLRAVDWLRVSRLTTKLSLLGGILLLSIAITWPFIGPGAILVGPMIAIGLSIPTVLLLALIFVAVKLVVEFRLASHPFVRASRQPIDRLAPLLLLLLLLVIVPMFLIGITWLLGPRALLWALIPLVSIPVQYVFQKTKHPPT